MPKINETRAWRSLEVMKSGFHPDLNEMFKNPNRAKNFSIHTDKIVFDYSRQLVTPEIKKQLIELANEANLKQKIEAMLTGEKINITENRAVLHTALRNLSGEPVFVGDKDVTPKDIMPEVNAVLNKIEKFSSEVLKGERLGVTGKKIKNIVAVGIGGSYLGPEYLAVACEPYAKPGMKLLFVSNVDGTDFATKTKDLDPEETMFVIISKTFTTAETMKNAETSKEWMISKLGDSAEVTKKHFIAVSTAEKLVKDFGIDENNIFGFWDWVGGRYSATSAVGGVPLSLFLGYENFHKILEGAHWMDKHFRNTPFEQNIPVMAALTDIWNINFMGLNTRAIQPYAQAYSKLAPHSQQVEMESLGKRVDIDGNPVEYATGEQVYGEPGTNCQHSYDQEVHQGTQIIPVDFIGFINPQYPVGANQKMSHQDELITNFFAQPDALAFGKYDIDQHKHFPGNRPSNVFLLKNQDPFAAGLLLALLEHRTAVKGFIWNINSFDQWGVQLGKVLGVDMRNRIEKYKADPKDPQVYKGLNASTATMFKMFLEKNLS